MRTCNSCGRENPDDRDFCECGEYLRWDPTGVVQAVTPEVLQAAAQPTAPAAQPGPAEPAPPPAAAAPPPAAPAQPQPPPAPATPPPAAVPSDGRPQSGDPLGAPPPPSGPPATMPPPAVPAAPAAPPPPPEPAEPDPAVITLRLAEGDTPDGPFATGVEPGGRTHVIGLIRNQSGIVDNYDLSVRGLPDDWWSVYPNTVYLVPFGTGGTYEQEVQIHFHPPRSPEAEARIWDLEIVAQSKAYNRQAAAASMHLGIQPFEEVSTKLDPQRASGRRKGTYEVAVKNTANAPVFVALEGEDPDSELDIDFKPPSSDITPGQTGKTKMVVRAPRRRWVGRPEEKRISVHTHTGEAAHQYQATSQEAQAAEEADGLAGKAKKGLRGKIMGPSAQVGPTGIRVQKPLVQQPRLPGARNIDLASLKGKGGTAAPTAPLLPNQVVFRHKALLPWWSPLLLLLLLLLALLLFLFLPRNVVVPDVVGSKSAFDAEKKLTDAELALAPVTKERVSTEAPPGTVIGQTPTAGEKAEKNSDVSLLVAIGNGRVKVPNVVGKKIPDAEKALREAELSIGQVSPAPPDPNGEIASQIPAAGEIVKEGKPVDLFQKDPKDKKDGGKDPADKKKDDKPAAPAALPALAGGGVAQAAEQAADAGLVPEKVLQFSKAPKGEVFGTDPPAGTKVAEGAKIKLLVSAGFPQLAFDDGKNIKLVNGADGKPLKAIAKGPQVEKDPTFSLDGTKVAFAGNGRVFLSDREKPDEPPVALTQQGEKFSDLAWAPTVDRNVLAMLRKKGDDQDLCFGAIGGDGMKTQCLANPNVNLIKTVRWAPDGKSVFALGVQGLGKFGIVRYTTKQPFSPDAKDWGKGKFVTDTSTTNKGVIDLAISPDGKRMAVVANFERDVFQLFLGNPKDFLLTDAKAVGVRACKVAWRSDNAELVVVQADEACAEANGQLVRMPVDKPREQQQLGLSGDNPVFQPLALG
jgi:beta-lactam-binding protein with PASTA domain